MTKTKIPFDFDLFIKKHGKDACVASFSYEGVKAILAKIEDYDKANADVDYKWQDFFTEVKEVWAEGVLVIPKNELKLEDIDVDRLKKIAEHKAKDTRCAELVYQTALGIAERNKFIVLPLKVSRFIINKQNQTKPNQTKLQETRK